MYLCHNNAKIPYGNQPSNLEQRSGVIGALDPDKEAKRRQQRQQLEDDEAINISMPKMDRLEIKDEERSLELKDGTAIHDVDTLLICTG